MMISKWSILGFGIGITFAIGSFIRYYIIFPDVDKALTDVIIGGLICAVAWLYNRQLQIGNEITAIEDFLQDKQEKEDEEIK